VTAYDPKRTSAEILPASRTRDQAKVLSRWCVGF
jgi:hypothetical protein